MRLVSKFVNPATGNTIYTIKMDDAFLQALRENKVNAGFVKMEPMSEGVIDITVRTYSPADRAIFELLLKMKGV